MLKHVETTNLQPTRTQDQQIFILLDCLSVTDLSSGCDFCALRLNFETREVHVECHKRNASVQTLFVQPNCHWDESYMANL